MKISNVMREDVKTMHSDQTVFEAAKIMRDENFGAVPVEEGERLQGMITDRDIVLRVVAEEKDPRATKVSDAMTEKIRFCFDDESVEEVGAKMVQYKVRRLPVLNRKKRLVGIVSLSDIAFHEKSHSVAHEAMSLISH